MSDSAEESRRLADVTSGEGKKTGHRERKELPLWQESILLLVIALGLAIVIKAFFVQAFYIPSPSMEPQFVKNDRILVQKVSYWRGSPQRGDIVVFKDPGNWLGGVGEPVGASGGIKKGLELVGLYPSGNHLVKRVIGVGGDHVVCCDSQDRITINGTPLRENYLPKGVTPSSSASGNGKFDVKVPQGKLWVMGDNRIDSADSRFHTSDPGGGFVNENLVVGKAWALVWPLGRAEFIHRPSGFKAIPDPQN